MLNDAIINRLEDRMYNCFHCGTELVPWNPSVFKDGVELCRQVTMHKWCKNCLCVIAHQLRALLSGEQDSWAGSGNYVADREINPTSVTFANGRRVFLNSEGFLDVETVDATRLETKGPVQPMPRNPDTRE